MKNVDKLWGLKLLFGNLDGYSDDYLCDDKDVNECVMNMYFYVLTSQGDFLKEFEKIYNRLTDEQKQMVINEYATIMEARSNKKLSLKRNDKNEKKH